MKCLLVEELERKPTPPPEEKPDNVVVLYPNPEKEYLDGMMHAQAMLDSLESAPRKKILTQQGILIFYAEGFLQTDLAPDSGHKVLREIEIPDELAEVVYQVAAVQQDSVRFYAKNPAKFVRDAAGEYVPVMPDEMNQRLVVIDRACTLLDKVFRPMFIELGLITESPAG